MGSPLLFWLSAPRRRTCSARRVPMGARVGQAVCLGDATFSHPAPSPCPGVGPPAGRRRAYRTGRTSQGVPPCAAPVGPSPRALHLRVNLLPRHRTRSRSGRPILRGNAHASGGEQAAPAVDSGAARPLRALGCQAWWLGRGNPKGHRDPHGRHRHDHPARQVPPAEVQAARD